MVKKINLKKNQGVKLVSQYRGRITLGGKRPYVYNYDLRKYYSAKKVTEFIIQKVNRIENSDKLFFATNARYYNLNNKTMFSGFTTRDKVNVLPTFLEDSYVISEDSLIRYVSLYVLDKLPIKNKKMVGNDEHNDCLFNSIVKAFSFRNDLLPKIICKPYKFKKYFGYDRNDKVELNEELFLKLEELIKCSFIVSGDFSYVSKEMKKVNISLKVKGEHITPTYNEGKESKLFPRSKENILSLQFVDDKIFVFDGKVKKEINDEEYKQYTENSKYLLIKCKGKDTIEETLNKYIKKADRLLQVSNKLINYYKSQYSSVIGFDIWKQMTKFISSPEELDDFEHIVINFALHGGIHYYREGEYENVIENDVNSAYMNFMSSSGFNFPVTKPNYKLFTQKEFDDLKFFPFGFYLVKFENTHDYFSNFKVGVNQWTTHHDLKCAKLLNVKFSIVEEKTNALLYDSKNCIKGSHAFSEYCNFLYKLKRDGEDVKDLTVSIWGVFAQKLTKIYRLKDDETIDIDDQFVISLIETGNTTIIKTTPQAGKIFKHSLARLAPFLTSYTRLKMIETIMKVPKENIIHINTDSFISTIPVKNLVISKELGEWKQHKGDCHVYNSMRICWLCSKCDEYGKKKCEC